MHEVKGQSHQHTPHPLCSRDALHQRLVTVTSVHHDPHYQKISESKLI
jgi:hypothetical protein